jgi:hypothetical protein
MVEGKPPSVASNLPEAPEWLNELHFLDRAAAIRILQQHGAAMFGRIARAAAAEKRPNNRPGQPMGALLQRATFEWLTHPDWDEMEAAKQTARRIVSEKAWQGIQPLSEPYLRRQLREQLRAVPTEVLAAAKDQARQLGRRTRLDPPAAAATSAEPRALSELLRALPRVRMRSVRIPPYPNRQALADVVGLIPSREVADTGERLVHLVRALAPDADHMTIPELRDLLMDIRRGISRGSAD